MQKIYLTVIMLFLVACVPTPQTLPNTNNPTGPHVQDAEAASNAAPVGNGRLTTMNVGLLPRYVGSFQGEQFALDLFRYGCQWSAVFRNRRNVTMAPMVRLHGIDARGNNVGYYTPLFAFPSIPPGTEARAFGTVDLCHNGPIRIEGGGRNFTSFN